MIDPIIVTFELFGRTFSIHWYGVIIAIAVMIGAFIAERQVARRGGNTEFVWDLIIEGGVDSVSLDFDHFAAG